MKFKHYINEIWYASIKPTDWSGKKGELVDIWKNPHRTELPKYFPDGSSTSDWWKGCLDYLGDVYVWYGELTHMEFFDNYKKNADFDFILFYIRLDKNMLNVSEISTPFRGEKIIKKQNSLARKELKSNKYILRIFHNDKFIINGLKTNTK